MKKNHWLIHTLRNFLCGLLIGAGAILPGVSGGVLAVIFDIYRPFMEVLTDPLRALPKYWRWIPALAVGCGVGFLGFARGISAALAYAPAAATWLFIGLIVGTLPALFREAGKEGRPAGAWVSLGVCAAVMFLGLLLASRLTGAKVTPNFWWYSFCGALWGLGIVVPGMTSSSVMMALGLYQPLMDSLSRMDIPVLAATVPGLLVTLAALARLMSWLFRRHYALAYHGMLGIVLASTLVILPASYRGLWEIGLSLASCALGFATAWLMGKLEKSQQE